MATSTKPKDGSNTNVAKKEKTKPLKPSIGSSSSQIPNYLKPTISSRVGSPPGPKPTLNRRRSLDNKPPSPTPSSNSRAGPTKTTDRASSQQQPIPSSRAPRALASKPQTLYVKSAKKGSGEAFVRKDHKTGVRDGSNSQAVVIVDDDQTHHHDHDHEAVKVIGSDQNGTKSEDRDEVSDISAVSQVLVVKSEDDHDHDHDDQKSIEESKDDREKLGGIQDGEKSEANEVVNSSVGDELVKEEDCVLKEEISGEDDDNKEEIVVDEKGLEEDKNDEEEEGKIEAKKSQSGKKESQIAYNDVIEETASKLLEKKKNKVKALVGAFETVIDYESK